MRRLRIWIAMKLLPADVQIAKNLTVSGGLNMYVPNSQLTGCTFDYLLTNCFVTLGDKA